jgi:membrane protein
MATDEADGGLGVVGTAKRAFELWRDADGPRLGAAVAFYSTLSLAPFLLLVVAIAGVFLGGDEARTHLVAEITNIVGPNAADLVEQLLAHGASARGRGWVAVLGVATLLFGATASFTELRAAVAEMFGEPSKTPLMAVVRTRALALALAVGTGFLLVVSLVASAAVAASLDWIAGGPLQAVVTVAASELTTFAVVAFAFAVLIKLLPTRRVPWRAALTGGAASAALFTVGKYALGAYIGRVASTSAFGASGAIVVIMLWVYYSAQMFLLGAALARVRAERAAHPYRVAQRARTMAADQR